LEPLAAVQGMAFAYAMINHRDFWTILETEPEFEKPEFASAYRDGLIYALEFWEWEAPGFLGSLNPAGSRSAQLIQLAQGEIDRSRPQGILEAFAVRTSSAV